MRYLNILLLTLLVGTIAFWIEGCGLNEELVTGPVVEDFISSEEESENPESLRSLGGWMSIAWPFGPNEHPDNWTGDEGVRTRGAWIRTRCRGWTWSHSGADYYARDLNRRDGNDYGKPVYAGFSGRAVIAGDRGDGYGRQVVIYDHSRRVAIRYAHLSSIAVSEGQWVQIRQHIGNVGNSGTSTGPHLHLAGYENIDHFYNNDPNRPVIPTLCDSEHYTCAIYFFC